MNRMGELCPDPYSLPYMKKQLLAYFGESLCITTINKRPNVVTIKRHAGEILDKFYADSHEESGEKEKIFKLVKTVAALIRSEIDAIKADRDVYPNINGLGDQEKHENYIPASLRLLLSEIFRGTISKSSQ